MVSIAFVELLIIIHCVVVHQGIPEIHLQTVIKFQVGFTILKAMNKLTIFLVAPPLIQHVVDQNPCIPSPCGPFSECRNAGGIPSCSCSVRYIGTPPNCRPECTVSSECPSNLACIAEKCTDPCPGSCGIGAECNTINHIPTCTCPIDYTGDPFRICTLKPPPPTSKTLSLII